MEIWVIGTIINHTSIDFIPCGKPQSTYHHAALGGIGALPLSGLRRPCEKERTHAGRPDYPFLIVHYCCLSAFEK